MQFYEGCAAAMQGASPPSRITVGVLGRGMRRVMSS